MIEFIPWVALVLGVVGIVFNAFRNIKGFHIWIVSNILFIYLAIKQGNWAQASFFIACTFACIFGIYKWRRKK